MAHVSYTSVDRASAYTRSLVYRGRTWSRWIARLLWVSYLIAFLVSAPLNAANEQTKFQIYIPQQRADKALTALGLQTERQILYPYELATGFIANRVDGEYTLRDAATLLLKGSGLRAVFSEPHRLRIEAVDNRRGSAMNQKKKGLFSILSSLFLSTGAAMSGNAVQAADTGSPRTGLEEVIVTATKRSESAQDVAIAINVLSGDQLHKQGAFGTDDISKLFTNLSLKASNPINTGFSIRGVGTENVHPIAQQAVGQYHDEVGMASPHTGAIGMFDIERVEVLRGPQNSLFGRNTTGGAVNFISRSPEVGGELNGYARARLGNEGRQDMEAAIGVPLGENAALRAAFQSQNRDGVFNNLFYGDKLGEIEKHSGRLQLAWEPSDRTRVLASHTMTVNRGNLPPNKGTGVFAANGVDPCSALTTGVSQFDGPNDCFSIDPRTDELVNISTNDWNDVNNSAPSRVDLDISLSFIKLTHDFDAFELTSITAYESVEVLQLNSNWSGAGYVGFIGGSDSEWEVFSQEVRLASTGDGALRWIAGGFYSTEDDQLATVVRNGSPAAPPQSVLPSVDLDQTVDIWSIYGKLDYDLTERATLTIGLRYTDDSKEADSTVRNMFGTDTGLAGGTRLPDTFLTTLAFRKSITDAPGVGPCPGLPCKSTIPVEQSLEEVGGNLTLDYHVTDDILAYVSYSRGFKSGAFDTRALAAFVGTADKPVGPEFLNAYEFGIKSTLADGSVELNGAVFFYEWEDMQIFDSDPVTGAPAFLNVGEVEITGAELDLRWSVGNGWYIQAGLGLLDSEVTDTGGLIGPTVGSRVTYTPEVSFNGLIRKEFDLGDSLVTLQTDFRYRDELSSSLDEDPTGLIDSVSFINASASINFGDRDQYELSVWGENLSEEKTCNRVADIGGLTFANMCQPNDGMAFYGVTLQVDF